MIKDRILSHLSRPLDGTRNDYLLRVQHDILPVETVAVVPIETLEISLDKEEAQTLMASLRVRIDEARIVLTCEFLDWCSTEFPGPLYKAVETLSHV
jgi:hypothetical protein